MKRLTDEEVKKLTEEGEECTNCKFFAICEGAETQEDINGVTEHYYICEDFDPINPKEKVTFD